MSEETVGDQKSITDGTYGGVGQNDRNETAEKFVNGADSDGLMWSMTDVRRLFKDYRMWPTFVGPKFLQHGVPRINLPVLLWKEQASYLQDDVANSSPTSSKLLAGKRKDPPVADNEEERSKRRKHVSTSSSTVSEEDRTRALIFKDLHDRSYFVGPADAYGGDYSLYKGGGDPTQTHSIATVRVIEKGHKISARELLAFSRVQNQVAKSAVLAFKLPPPVESANNTSAVNILDAEVGRVETNSVEGNTSSADATQVGYIVINFRNVSDRV